MLVCSWTRDTVFFIGDVVLLRPLGFEGINFGFLILDLWFDRLTILSRVEGLRISDFEFRIFLLVSTNPSILSGVFSPIVQFFMGIAPYISKARRADHPYGMSVA